MDETRCTLGQKSLTVIQRRKEHKIRSLRTYQSNIRRIFLACPSAITNVH